MLLFWDKFECIDDLRNLGVGIRSMQERVKLIGGRLDIDSTGRGTTVRVTIPLLLEANILGVERT